MAAFNLLLNRTEILRLFFRLSQCQVVGGRLAQVAAFMKRILKVWPELAPGEPEEVAALISLDERRPLTFTAEEQSAVADAMLNLLNTSEIATASGTMVQANVGVKLEILRDIDLLGSPIARHVSKRLSSEVVTPFIEDIDTDNSEEITKLS